MVNMDGAPSVYKGSRLVATIRLARQVGCATVELRIDLI